MFLVALTGGIASGKTTVADRLVKHGAELIDADEIAREQAVPGSETWKRIVEHFGEDVLDEDGFIDRARLGALVFGDPARRALLNELTHPPVVAAIADRLEVLTAFDGVVVVDVPLLVEASIDNPIAPPADGQRARPHGYDAIVVVATKPETQLTRLVEQRGMTPPEAERRIAAQAPLEDKLAVASHVLWNDGDRQELLTAVDNLAGELTELARRKAEAEARGIPND